MNNNVDLAYHIEIRGEIVLPWKDFHEINEERIANGEKPYANPRNAASGILKTKNSKYAHRLECYAYQVIFPEAAYA